jgi:3-hydroxyisobutyrate dehydrogenase-like beta-hydroxyacid dehydrogenase
MSKPRIGWIGLGHMGVPMTANLQKAGFPLMVWNRTRSKAEAVAGAFVAASPAELASSADIIVTMVSDDASQEEVLFGPGGVAEGLSAGQVVINMGTISPAASRSAAERLGKLGVHVLDAPVAGSVKPATDGTLVILVGGEADVLARCQPIFEVLGKRTFHFGPAGQGANAKLSINMLLGILLQGVGESLTFGEAAGLDRSMLLEMFAETPCASPILAMKAPSLNAGDYPPAFPLKHMAKDFRLMLDAAKGSDTSLIEAASTNFRYAEEAGLGDQDVMAVIKVLER